MKITELIELLQKAKNENGDIEVVITDTYCESEVDWDTLGEVWGEPTPKAVFLPKDNTYNERGEKLCA